MCRTAEDGFTAFPIGTRPGPALRRGGDKSGGGVGRMRDGEEDRVSWVVFDLLMCCMCRRKCFVVCFVFFLFVDFQ